MTIIQNVSKNDQKNNGNEYAEKMLKAAIAYAKFLNWHVFPVHSVTDGKCSCSNPKCSHIAKHPITRNGLKDATTDLQVIHKWWTDYPGANIGIRTGEESGIFVLDVDTNKVNGMESLQELEQQHGELPATVQALTGGGGLHYLFKYHAGIGNKTNFKPGLDIRGDGGYIVASPSIHASNWCYEWEVSSRPLEVEIAIAPGWLIGMITQESSKRGGNPVPQPPSHWQKLMSGLSEGEGRNPAAASIIGHLLRRYVDPLLVVEIMQMWNERNDPPMEPNELEKILDSVAGRELRRREGNL